MSGGSIIRKARAAKGLSQRKLAELADIDYTYVSKIENGTCDYPPKEEVLCRLYELLGINEQMDFDWLCLEFGIIPDHLKSRAVELLKDAISLCPGLEAK